MKKHLRDHNMPHRYNKDMEYAATGSTLMEVENMDSLNRPGQTEQLTAKVLPAPSVWKDLLFLLMKIAAITVTFVLLFTFLFGIMRYHEPSMAPAVKDGDLVLFYRYNARGYLPQDVVVLNISERQQIRRVIATAGDMVDITEDGLLINGALQLEREIYQRTERYEEGIDFPLTVAEGQVFVLSDSRIGATDSRLYGCVEISDTLGKVMTVIRRRSI